MVELTVFSAILVLLLHLPCPSFALPPVHQPAILNSTIPHTAVTDFPPPCHLQPHSALTSLNLGNLTTSDPPRPTHQPRSCHLASQASGRLPTGPTGYLWTTNLIPLPAGIADRHFRLKYRASPALHSMEIRQLTNLFDWKSLSLTKRTYPPWQETVGEVDFQVIRFLRMGYLHAVLWLEPLPPGVRSVTEGEVDWFQLLG